MSGPSWQSVRGRVRRWLARSLRPDPSGRSEPRPRIRFGPESAVTSSPARWWMDAPPPLRPRMLHPSYDRPRDREGEYQRLQDEVARLVHPHDRPPTACD